MKPFVHLHVHTQYSLLDSTCRISDLVAATAEQDVKAVAMTDHGVMSGAIDFYKRCREKNVRPLIGCEMYVARESHLEHRAEAQGNPNHHLVLLARNLEGYHNLVRLNTIAHLEGFFYKPRIDKELLARYSKGLIGLAGCLQGEVSQYLVEGNMAGAVRTAGAYSEMFGRDGFYLEFQDHGIPEQKKVNRALGKLSKKTKIPIVATNDVHYLRREHAAVHEILLCLQTQTVMNDPIRMRYPTNEFFLKTGEEMARLSAEFPDAVPRTVEVAEQCDVNIEFGRLHFPMFRPPGRTTKIQFITRLCRDGMKRLYGVGDADYPQTDREKEVVERCRHELEIIEKTGFIDYFLVVWDYVDFAKKRGIPVSPGRGSVCGSLVAYLMGITAVDPLRFGLVFERFLNPERHNPPDIDVDFCILRRGEVIEYVKQKYGRDHVAQIVTFGSFGPKTVINDIGRVLEIPLTKINQFVKMVPDDYRTTLDSALKGNSKFADAYQKDSDCKRILNNAFVLEGLPRSAGVHAAGVVISEKPLIEILPLCRDKEGSQVTQYTMDSVGEVGLLKMDFLGFMIPTILQKATEMIRMNRGVTVNLDRLPLDDKPTYKLLNSGRTAGIFLLESKGMQNLIREGGIGNIEDLMALFAMYRPGLMAMLPEYIARKTGKGKNTYDHPLLEPILKDTYGIMIYQEQVQTAANVLAGYTLGAADKLRRTLCKLKKGETAKERNTFISGCLRVNKIAQDKAGRIFDTLTEFAPYGFNKAHAAAYALLSYQTAYMKAHYPVEFKKAVASVEAERRK